MTKNRTFFRGLGTTVKAHKILSAFVIAIIVFGGYMAVRSATKTNATPQYSLSRARMGSIVETVSGSGQVSAQNQLDVTSKASGAVTSINVKVGDHVKKGQLLATIDSANAAISLENARLSYAKFIQPPKDSDIVAAQNSLTKSYNDAWNEIAAFFLDMPSISSGLKDLFYSKGAYLSDEQSANLITSARGYRDSAGAAYDSMVIKYQNVLDEYKNLNRSSATSSIDRLLSDSYNLAKDAANTLQKTQNTIVYITSVQSSYSASTASSAKSNVDSWYSTINADVSSLLSAQNAITSAQNSLSNLTAGPDQLDIASEKLSLKQQEQSYEDYFIRAPFDGVVGRIPVSVYSQAGNSTVIATIIGDNKMATISLNEIDAAKVHTGDNVELTFDAIDGLSAKGTVSEVDLVGTVTQGVVTYNVKITIDTTNARILPGMSVNASIITNRLDNVLVVPSSAIKSQGQTSYVQVFDTLPENATSTISSNSFTARNSNRTITSKTAPRNQNVTVGASDENNTEITSGISAGAWVVTRIISSGTTSASPTTAPSILNSLGGNRSAGGGNAVFRAR